MAQSFGNTWWGNYWLKSLDNIDYENRIPRGASYARSGQVKEVKINGNTINAKVAGSQLLPYNVTIIVPPFFKEQTNRLMEKIMDRPALISKLLNRELDPEILAIAESCNLKVFPRQWTDFKMQCSCPDWAVPCKHLAAVIYMMSREIDNNPFLVFEIHNVNLIEELRKRGFELDTKSRSDIPQLAELLVRKQNKDLADELPEWQRADFSKLQDIGGALVQLLPANPSLYTQGDFREKYRAALLRVVKNTKRLFKRNLDVQTLFPLAAKPNTLSHHSKIEFEINAYWEGTVICYKTEGKKRTPTFNREELICALFAIQPDRISDYQPSVMALHQMLMAALHLLSHGAVIPQIVSLDNRQKAIRWLPACIDTQVRALTDELQKQLPDGIIHLDPKNKGAKDSSTYLKNQAETLLSYFFDALVPALSGVPKENICLSLFFDCRPYPFNEVGEQEMAGALKSWMDRYFMTSGAYRPVFLVEEDLDNNAFLLNIQLEKTELPRSESLSLNKILTSPEFLKERFTILRELSLLSGLITGLDDHINHKAEKPIRFDNQSFVPFLLEVLPAVRLLNVKVLLPKSLQELIRPKATLKIKRKSTSESAGFIRLDELLAFDWQVAVGDEVLPPDLFDKMLKGASQLLRFKQNYIYANEEDLQKLYKAITQETPLTPIQLLQSALMEEYDSKPILLTDEVKEMIRTFASQEEIPLPAHLNATLRPYQARGFSWMYRNMRIGFGSIIADDMGLGKTLQVIALILKLQEEGRLKKEKVLIVVPTGLLTNWQSEIEKFAPSVSSYIYHGTARELEAFDADVMLTTYGVLRSDAALLKKKKWQLMIIDEAQNIKNEVTAQSKAVRSIPANVHIAMSGTPVENRLSEFWSIMDFSNKGYLGSIKNFKDNFAQPIQLFNDMDCVNRFRKITAPFMMRRLKSDKSIISDLPDKIEQDEFALLTQSQAALYHQTLEAAMSAIEGIESTDHQSLFKRQGLVLQMILTLKQICNHPTQFLKNGIADATLSGKTLLLLDLVETIAESGDKVLIFTQFREMGDLLQTFLEERLGERPMFYHGGCSMKERETMVNRFQHNKADKVFLLSLKSAGTGLNLTAASHVIHYDLWWNPAVEAQATDRAYRIGQNNNVMVHRFITKNTFEEKINAMIQQKKNLAELTVTSGESWIGKLSNKELRELF
ncbi:MAG: DEAD/DEAH box helicase [Bacteroides sp.]